VTVAAVVLAATPASALADADGLPRARRIADTAWAGGATPIVVVSFDLDGAVASALAGAPVTLAEPAPVSGGPVGQMVRGIEVAAAGMTGTTAALVWPMRMCWVGAETATSLIEAHGTDPAAALAPGYHGEPGWPRLIPIEQLDRFRAMPADLMPDDLVARFFARPDVAARVIELGDPGTVIDGETSHDALPPYEGPPVPAAGHVHEWGAQVADTPDDTPLEGPALAPYGPAAADDIDPPG
jgi:hypothetical protein